MEKCFEGDVFEGSDYCESEEEAEQVLACIDEKVEKRLSDAYREAEGRSRERIDKLRQARALISKAMRDDIREREEKGKDVHRCSLTGIAFALPGYDNVIHSIDGLIDTLHNEASSARAAYHLQNQTNSSNFDELGRPLGWNHDPKEGETKIPGGYPAG